jgi:hypothetical protein
VTTLQRSQGAREHPRRIAHREADASKTEIDAQQPHGGMVTDRNSAKCEVLSGVGSEKWLVRGNP